MEKQDLDYEYAKHVDAAVVAISNALAHIHRYADLYPEKMEPIEKIHDDLTDAQYLASGLITADMWEQLNSRSITKRFQI